jgi:hypothetical protein
MHFFWTFGPLLFYSVLICVNSKNVVTFRAESSLSVSLPSHITTEVFSEFFSQNSIPELVMSLNPGIESVEKLEGEQWRGHLAPQEFPGVCIKSTVDFEYEFLPGRSLAVRCLESGLKQQFEGSKMLVGILSKLETDVSSENVLTYDPVRKEITNCAQLQLTFPFPDRFPVPKRMVEAGGSKAINANLSRDLDGLLNNLLAVCDTKL